MFRVALMFAGFALLGNIALSQTANPPKLDDRIRAEVAPFKGKVFLYAKNLDTGETYSFNGDERVRTASTIKIAVMIEAFARVAEGKAKWSDELVLTKAARYGGSGILPELSDGLRLTLQDALRLMMVLSDNTATNMVLGPSDDGRRQRTHESLGFKATRIMRRVGSGGESKEGKLGDNLKRFGLGATTPQEMVLIMEKLERGEIVSKEASKQMIDLMKREQGRNSIGRTCRACRWPANTARLMLSKLRRHPLHEAGKDRDRDYGG